MIQQSQIFSFHERKPKTAIPGLLERERNKREKIYISYDSTNKNCEAGNISMVEFGAAKIDAGLPIFNYAVGYDLNNSEPLIYENIRAVSMTFRNYSLWSKR